MKSVIFSIPTPFDLRLTGPILSAEDEAPTWTSEKQYPSFLDLVTQVREVVLHYKLNRGLCFGLGVGLGASIILHYAVRIDHLLISLYFRSWRQVETM